jgi:hypothetical protein
MDLKKFMLFNRGKFERKIMATLLLVNSKGEAIPSSSLSHINQRSLSKAMELNFCYSF